MRDTEHLELELNLQLTKRSHLNKEIYLNLVKIGGRILMIEIFNLRFRY